MTLLLTVFLRRALLGLLVLVWALPAIGGDANVWTGPRITFIKANNVDPLQPANQDRLTPRVWLTRGSSQGLFNAAQEPGYDGLTGESPIGTEWAFGTTANYATLDYLPWLNWAGEGPISTLGLDAVMHLIEEDVYIDVKFTSWTSMAGGGGFSYERSTPSQSGDPVGAIEYYHATFDHYFVTSNADEISKLDNGTFAGWARTGLTFKVYSTAVAGASPVCRFFSAAFDPRSSHFYTPIAAECTKVKSDPNWQFEGDGSSVFFIAMPAADGSCSTGTTAVYRLYNNGRGGAPNHRYTTASNIRDQMIATGWVLEGNGPGFAFMCAPQ